MENNERRHDEFDNLLIELGLDSLREDELRVSMSKLSRNDYVKIFNAHAYDSLRSLAAVATEWIGISTEDVIQRIAQVSVIETLAINGNTWTPDDGAHFNIEVNVGLGLFCNRVADVFVANIGRVDEKERLRGGGLISREEAARQIKMLVKSYINDQLSYLANPVLELGAELREYATELSAGLIEFVIGHELGHVIVTASEKGRELQQIVTDLLRERLENIKGLGDPNGLATEWGKELAADFISLRTVLEHGSSTHYSSMELFFVVCDLLEAEKKDDSAWEMVEAFENTGDDWALFETFAWKNNHFLGTHPPATMRRNFLHLITDHLPAFVRTWGKKADSLRDAVLQVQVS